MPNNTLPKIATQHSIKINVEEGETYAWCACGLSANQPFCDGSHAGSEFSPVSYVAQESKIISFCGCKRSTKGVICDGTHKQL